MKILPNLVTLHLSSDIFTYENGFIFYVTSLRLI